MKNRNGCGSRSEKETQQKAKGRALAESMWKVWWGLVGGRGWTRHEINMMAMKYADPVELALLSALATLVIAPFPEAKNAS